MRENRMYVKREDRIPLKAATTVESFDTGQSSQANSVNISSSGVLLHFDEPVPLAVGDRVTCDFLVEHAPELPLPYWGLGRIVRVDSSGDVAVELKTTGLAHLAPKSTVVPIPVPDRF